MGCAIRVTHQLRKLQLMGIAEFIIGRAFARPVGSTLPTSYELEVAIAGASRSTLTSERVSTVYAPCSL